MPFSTGKFVLWGVDMQVDFMLPAGKLYVPGAEKLLPNINRLVDAARRDRVFLVSHGCFHTKDDPEFETFPPHCIEGTPGAAYIPEALTTNVLRVPNKADASIAQDLSAYQQILLEKQTLDIFRSRHAQELLDRIPGGVQFFVFGVVTEYCVRFAAKGLLDRGRQVSIIEDAIESLNPAEGERATRELKDSGATFITTNQALNIINSQ